MDDHITFDIGIEYIPWYNASCNFQILEISPLKQKKNELNISISYGDMGVCWELLGVVARLIKFQKLGNI